MFLFFSALCLQSTYHRSRGVTAVSWGGSDVGHDNTISLRFQLQFENAQNAVMRNNLMNVYRKA